MVHIRRKWPSTAFLISLESMSQYFLTKSYDFFRYNGKYCEKRGRGNTH